MRKTFAATRVARILRPIARRLGLARAVGAWDELGHRPWDIPTRIDGHHVCNICHWSGDEFVGSFHSEMATCPRCGSIARDRFLMFCFLSRTTYRPGLVVLETSPRLGAAYRRMMRTYFSYTASDFDLSAHEGDIRLDLQAIDLPDSSVDVLVTPHVLEHVPDTGRALAEIHRILAPHGRMYLQVPLCRGTTATPATPEFHADNTPVFFNFGWDLTDAVRAAGFEARVLVTADYAAMLGDRTRPPTSIGDGFDLDSLWTHARTEDLETVASQQDSFRFGFLPAHHFATWECVKI